MKYGYAALHHRPDEQLREVPLSDSREHFERFIKGGASLIAGLLRRFSPNDGFRPVRKVHWGFAKSVLGLATFGSLISVAQGFEAGRIALSENNTRIVVSNENRSLGDELSEFLDSMTKTRVPILLDSEVDDSHWRRFHFISIGNLNDNRVSGRLYDDNKAFLDAFFPGPGGLMVKTLVDPLGRGKNVILVGGSNLQGHRDSLNRFKEMVRVHGDELPALHALVSESVSRIAAAPGDMDAVLENHRRSIENASTRLGNVVTFGFNFHFTNNPVWARLYRGTLLQYIRHARAQGDWNYDPNLSNYFNYSAIVDAWALIEHSREFSDSDREIIRQAFFDMAEDFAEMSYMSPLANPPGEPRQNHTTYALRSLEAAVRYFERRGAPEVERWRNLGHQFLQDQVETYRSDDDGGGYTWYVPMHAFEFFQRQNLNFAHRKGFLDTVADLAVVVTDNRRDEVTFGDVRTYVPWSREHWPHTATVLSRAAWVHGDPGHRWAFLWLSEGRSPGPVTQLYAKDLDAREPDRLKGIREILLDSSPLRWISARVQDPSWLPVKGKRYLDKLSIRPSFDPEDEYLLLDGTAAFVHGHKDANSILRLTWRDRIWLVDLDYIHQLPRYHNSIEVARNGKTGIVPPLSELAVKLETDSGGFIRSDLNHYNGIDWRRNLVWKKGRYFVVIDELKASQAGNYDFRCYWRTLGDVGWNGSTMEVRQPGAYFRVANADRAFGSLWEIDPALKQSTQFGDWSRYSHSDPVVRTWIQRQVANLSPGESTYFINLLYARSEDDSSDLTIRRLSDAVAIVRGEGENAIIGLARKPVRFGEIDLRADLFRLGTGTLEASALRYLEGPQGGLIANSPVDVEMEEGGKARLVAHGETSLRFLGDWRLMEIPSDREVIVAAGEHQLKLSGIDFSAEEFDELWETAEVGSIEEESVPVEFGMQMVWDANVGADPTRLIRREDDRGWILGFRDGRIVEMGADGSSTVISELESEVRDILPLREGGFVVGDREGNVFRMTERGETLWHRRFDEYWTYPERIVSLTTQSVEGGERFLVGTEPPRVHALDLDGKLLWSTPSTTDSRGRAIEWWGSLTGLKSVDLSGNAQDEIVVGTEYQTPIAILGEEGRLKWLAWGWVCCESRAQTPYLGTNARVLEIVRLRPEGPHSIIYGTESDEVYVLNGDGELQWMSNVGGEVEGLAVRDLNGDGNKEIVAITASGNLVVLDHSGNRKWWRSHESGLSALAVQIVEETGEAVIAAGSQQGWLYAYNQDGDLVAVARIGDRIVHLDAVSRGWGEVVVATRSGTIGFWRLQAQRPYSRSSRHHY